MESLKFQFIANEQLHSEKVSIAIANKLRVNSVANKKAMTMQAAYDRINTKYGTFDRSLFLAIESVLKDSIKQ